MIADRPCRIALFPQVSPPVPAGTAFQPLVPALVSDSSLQGHTQAAVSAVEQGLPAEGDPLSQVLRIDIPAKEPAVFGVGMKAVSDDETALFAANPTSGPSLISRAAAKWRIFLTKSG